MAKDNSNESQAANASVSELWHGILGDIRHLLLEELQAAKEEVHANVDSYWTAVVALGIGLGVSIIGVGLLALMSVQILYAFCHVPLWEGYALCGGAITVIGLLLLYKANNLTGETHHLLPHHTLHALKEDSQWIKNHVMSSKK